MEKFNLDDFKGGWFVGNFLPTLFNTNDVEVSVKKYKKGQKENAHYHKIATEFTVVVKGKVRMTDQIFKSGDIIKILPGISTDFEAIAETITVVVKIPGANNDKYLK